MTLADALRVELGMTGTHLGCEQGGCGACTVIADGRDIRSCLQLAVQTEGQQIDTIEGLGTEETLGLHSLQQSFLDDRGFQCGFCTPGMIMTILTCGREDRVWDERALRERLSGNVCRCTGYESIIAAGSSYLRSLDRWSNHAKEEE